MRAAAILSVAAVSAFRAGKPSLNAYFQKTLTDAAYQEGFEKVARSWKAPASIPGVGSRRSVQAVITKEGKLASAAVSMESGAKAWTTRRSPASRKPRVRPPARRATPTDPSRSTSLRGRADKPGSDRAELPPDGLERPTASSRSLGMVRPRSGQRSLACPWGTTGSRSPRRNALPEERVGHRERLRGVADEDGDDRGGSPWGS